MRPPQMAGTEPGNMQAGPSQVASLLCASGLPGPREVPLATDPGSLSLFWENPVVFARKLGSSAG